MGAVVLLGLVTSPALADRPFAQRFAINETGNIAVAANTLSTCNPAVAGCTNAHAAGPGTGTVVNNDGYAWVPIDIDGGGGNSSAAVLRLPPGAEVLRAYLYWGADAHRPGRGRPGGH